MKMAPTLSRHTRGVYSLITTFLFIMVIVFVVIGVIYVGSIIKSKKGEVNDELVKYDYIKDAKDRILSSDCYGQVIKELKANETCEFPPGIIKGYIIKMLAYENCTNVTKEWKHVWSTEDGEVYPYFVTIQANSTGNICPGRLEVIY